MRIALALTSTAALGALAACDAPVAAPDPATEAPVAQTATAEAGAPVPMPAGLTSEERFIWSTLTPQAQQQAAAFIANGGTLTQFINA